MGNDSYIIRFEDSIWTELTKINDIMTSLASSQLELQNLAARLAGVSASAMQDPSTLSEADTVENDAYLGKGSPSAVIFYQTLNSHLLSLINLYSVLFQQAINSYTELYNADQLGG